MPSGRISWAVLPSRYGLDADLVMLGLVSHEPHFCLLREVVSFGGANRGRPSRDVLENPCAEHFVLLQIGRGPHAAPCLPACNNSQAQLIWGDGIAREFLRQDAAEPVHQIFFCCCLYDVLQRAHLQGR